MQNQQWRHTGGLTRREILALLSSAACGLLPSAGAPVASAAVTAPIMTRPIPKTGERLPVVGLGTSRVFDVGTDAAQRAKLLKVLRALIAGGGKVVDTASAYASAEPVLGALLAQSGLRPRVFIATKLEADELTEAGIEGSLKRLQTRQIDLMQLHNVSAPNQSLAVLRQWKERGLCRYIGITSTFHGAYPAVEAVLRQQKPDFVEIDYSLDALEAEQRILPLCADLGVATLIARPLVKGGLFRKVMGQPVPAWAGDFAQSWAQFFLKFVLSNPAVTAVIPGTNNPAHMADDLGAGRGPLPNAGQRQRIIEFIHSQG
ncbi:MAG TPA: aldo/keto reductase [Candidatus Binataceae bacterium]|nr:aldo/keto reductase [Candidatus Binataceae bacterium]